MVVTNPYAKKRPRPATSVAVQYRPNPYAVKPLSAATRSNFATVQHAGSSSIYQSQPSTAAFNYSSQPFNEVAKDPTPVKPAAVNFDVSFDDGGIDWTEALQQIDKTVEEKQQTTKPGPVAPVIPPKDSPATSFHNKISNKAIVTSISNNDPPKPVNSLQPKTTLPASRDQIAVTTKPSTSSKAAAVAVTLERPTQWSAQALAAKSSTAERAQQKLLQNGSIPKDQIPAAIRGTPERSEPIRDEYRSPLVKNARLSQPLDNGWKLFSHQKKAILRAILMRRMILALDMGLGKTLIGCVWARAFQKAYGDELKVICVCPVSLVAEWKRTAEEATSIVVEVVGTGKNNKPDPESRLMHICSWAKIPDKIARSIRHYVVVCDEAHSMQSIDAARTKAVLNLTKSNRCVGVLLLSGTPMKNGKPSNLFPLLKAVRHPFGDNRKAYETHFCDGREKSFGRGRSAWDANGASNLDQLGEHISTHLLHMTKKECLGDTVPPQTRVIKKVPVSSKHQLQHNQALNKLATIYAETGKLESAGDDILSAVARVRHIGSYAKISATVAITCEVLKEQPAVVIFTSFSSVAKLVHKRLSESGWEGELLTGETPAKKRQPMVDRFQEGLSPVFVATFGAGGVGLTLTAAYTIILLDRPWTPGEARQAEDRVRRIGQTKPVTSIWMVAFDLDHQIDSVLEQKTSTTNVVLADGVENKKATAAGAPKISVFQMLKSVLSNTASAQSTLGYSVPATSTNAGSSNK